VDGSQLQGESSRPEWSVQPCVRPVKAVRMTAGHNALRGSDPGQKLAFDHVLPLVGCPDRRIDRPPLHYVPALRRCPGDFRLAITRRNRRVLS